MRNSKTFLLSFITSLFVILLFSQIQVLPYTLKFRVFNEINKTEVTLTAATTDTTPTVTTDAVTDITQYTATSGGNVTSDGGSLISAVGVCWNTAGSPTINDNKTVDGRATGAFTSKLTGLNYSTKYYVRAYATNGFGTAYGQEVSFESQDTTGLLVAFPGAEGFGKYTTGGRGGRVVEVTNLNDDGNPGSLRYAIDQTYPRIIVFRVSGTIHLTNYLQINNGNLTIAGQTAPGDGICLADYTTELKADNVIVRYIRFRLGDIYKIADDTFWGRDHHDIIIDHCSFSWAIDENGSWYDNKNFTMQWCINGESLYHSYHPKGDHGYGGIWGGMGATFHHNLLADNSSRNPRFNGARYNSTHETELADFRNNVIFNWGFNSAYGGESGNYNMINNYFKSGPATSSSKKSRIVNPYDPLNPPTGYSKWYINGNYVVGDTAVTSDNWNGGVQPQVSTIPLDSLKLNSPLPVYPVTTQSAQDAYNSVLQSAGASYPKRDSVDLRIVNEVKSGLAPYGATYAGGLKGIIDSQTDVGGWPVLNSATPPTDTDHDGMPDDWETQHGLNPNDSTDSHQVGLDGYTMIEEYINGLVSGNPTAIQYTKHVPTHFSLKQNYPNPFNPSTTIQYETSSRQYVSLKVYDILGREIATLVNEVKPAGIYNVTFNATSLSSGIYFYRITAGSFERTRKMMLVK